jgi:integrase
LQGLDSNGAFSQHRFEPGHGDVEAIFATKRNKPIGPWSRIKLQLDAAMKTTPWRLHDLRRTFSTNLNKIGLPPHVVEACLNHISGAQANVAGVYNRHTYLPEKTAALERWANHVIALVEGRSGKIISMKRKTRAAQ